jgi:hypothetical protein
VAIPLAIVLGFLVSAPGMGSIVIIGLLLFLFLLPFLLKHHHLLLIVFWNSAFNVFFLPGQPHFWLLLAGLSLGISWLNNVMGQKNFIKAPELTRPLIFFAIIILVTAFARGGLGIRALGGSSYGGKGYFYMIGAIVGYFALSAERVPQQKANRWTGLFFLSGSTFALSNLVLILGSSFYILYLLVPPEYAISQAQAELGTADVDRIAGLPPTCTAVICFLLVRYGLRGIMDWQKPWRSMLFFTMLVVVGFGGFRSVYLLIGLILLMQFFFEGLHRTIFLPISAALAVGALAFIVVYSSKLPLAIQRAVSFLPVKVDSSVASDAAGSLDWRFDMWKTLTPDIPQYLIIGKGYRIDPEDLYLADIATQLGYNDLFEVSRVAGDYHSGPLSLIISFGLFGSIAFLWLLYAGIMVLYRNYRYGAVDLHKINTFLLAFFIAHALFFFALFGDIRSDLFTFTGILGISVSLNGGVAKKLAKKPAMAAAQLVPQPA